MLETTKEKKKVTITEMKRDEAATGGSIDGELMRENSLQTMEAQNSGCIVKARRQRISNLYLS